MVIVVLAWKLREIPASSHTRDRHRNLSFHFPGPQVTITPSKLCQVSLWAVLKTQVGNHRWMIHQRPDRDIKCSRENNNHMTKGNAEISMCLWLRSHSNIHKRQALHPCNCVYTRGLAATNEAGERPYKSSGFKNTEEIPWMAVCPACYRSCSQ